MKTATGIAGSSCDASWCRLNSACITRLKYEHHVVPNVVSAIRQKKRASAPALELQRETFASTLRWCARADESTRSLRSAGQPATAASDQFPILDTAARWTLSDADGGELAAI